MVNGKLDNKEVTLLNVYAPRGSNKTFYEKIFDLFIFQSAGVTICAGRPQCNSQPKAGHN